MTRTTSGEWILSPANDLTSTQLTAGISALNDALRGGPTARIAASLMRLISATRRPAWMDDETAAVYFDTVQEAMHDFPIDCVEEACIAWRRNGKPGYPDSRDFWPSEGELRGVCEKLFEPRRSLRNKALLLLQHLEAEEERADRARRPSPFAGDAGREFKETMRKRMRPQRFEAYFHSSQIKFAGETEILVRTIAAENALRSTGGDVLDRLGLTVRYDPVAFAREPQPRWEDESPADRVEVTGKLNRLKAALAKNEDLKRLREREEI